MFTILFWFKSWIYSEMRVDLQRIKYEMKLASTTVTYETVKRITNNASVPRNVEIIDYDDGYESDSDLHMDKNPCGNAVSADERFRLAFSLLDVLLTFYYLFSL